MQQMPMMIFVSGEHQTKASGITDMAASRLVGRASFAGLLIYTGSK
jgi:hypothetical protein